MHEPEAGHGQSDNSQPYRMHGHCRPANECEDPKVSEPPALQEGYGEAEGHGQKKEVGNELVLRYATDELSPEGELRGVDIEQEEQGVEAAGEEGGRPALEEYAGQGVESQHGYEDEGRGQPAHDHPDRVHARDPAEGGLLQQPPVYLHARESGYFVAKVRIDESEMVRIEVLPHPR